MRDLFDILSLPVNAPASQVRRACARRPRRPHPDFDCGDGQAARAARGAAGTPVDLVHEDVAIDFVDMTGILDRMQTSFFGSAR